MAITEPNGSAFDTLQQAAEWFAILQDAPSPAEREAWRLWLQACPEHASAWGARRSDQPALPYAS